MDTFSTGEILKINAAVETRMLTNLSTPQSSQTTKSFAEFTKSAVSSVGSTQIMTALF